MKLVSKLTPTELITTSFLEGLNYLKIEQKLPSEVLI